MVPTSAEANILSKRAFSTFRILPLSGRIAWYLTVAALLGGAAGGIALHQVELRQGRVFLLAIRQFARQPGDVQGALAPRHFPRLARGFTRPGRIQHFAHHRLGFPVGFSSR